MTVERKSMSSKTKKNTERPASGTGTGSGTGSTENVRITLPRIIGYLAFAVVAVLFLLALFTFDADDLAILDGGKVGYLSNKIGCLGAQVSRAFFYLFGFAAYPIAFLLLLLGIRGLIPVPRKKIMGYRTSLFCAVLGVIMLFGMWPEDYVFQTDQMGLGRIGRPELALSGGVIGAQLAAPAESDTMEYAGILRKNIGEVGTLIVIAVLLLPGIVIGYISDWHQIVFRLLRGVFNYFMGNRELLGRFLSERKKIRKEKAADDEKNKGTPAEASEPEDEEDGNAEDTAELLPDFPPEDEHPEEDAEEEIPPENDGELNEEPEDDDAEPADPGVTGRALAGLSNLFSRNNIQPNVLRNDKNGEESPAEDADNEDDEDEELYRQRFRPQTEARRADVSGRTGTGPSDVPPWENHAEEVRPSVSVSRQDYAEKKREFDTVQPVPTKQESREAAAHHTETKFVLPLPSLLDKHDEVRTEDKEHVEASRQCLQKTLDDFGVDGRVSNIVVGPRVTCFEVSLAPGVKVEKVTGIAPNISMDMSAKSIRILAPIPGKDVVGIEVPNKVSSIVYIRSLIESAAWQDCGKSIPIILGRDIAGQVMITDLAKAPHLLIAGSTGSGKSVCMNTLIMSLLYKFSPMDLRLILVDPKVVELEMYRKLPHLITPVVNDPKKVPLALRWGVNEMERRYKIMAKVLVKNLAGFNSRPQDPVPMFDDEGEVIPQKMPLLVIIIDELADIMMSDAKKDVETSICRIAQKGRAAGIHLVIATQTPRKDVVTGLIKANLPTKIAFKVGANIDSRVILDTGGAEKLLGQGDMLFRPPGADGLERIQGSMVSDGEIQKVVDFVSGQVEQHFDDKVVAEDVEVQEGGKDIEPEDAEDAGGGYDVPDDVIAQYLKPDDPKLLRQALELIVREQKASTSYLQRRLGIGYNTQADLMDRLEERGVISAPLPGGQKREILITAGLDVQE